MSYLERNWQFVEQFHEQSTTEIAARRLSAELGVEPVSSAIAAQLGLIAHLTNAQQILEIGTGVGVSSLALLSLNSSADLTTIDIESEYLRAAKEQFAEAHIASGRIRAISGDAVDVLTRMNLNSYDISLVDADPLNMLQYVEFSLKIVRPGGMIIVPHALWNGTVSDPAARGSITEDFRTLLSEIAQSDAGDSLLSPVGDGLLLITKRETT
jgi:predicted O-methyltransferase YrrM